MTTNAQVTTVLNTVMWGSNPTEWKQFPQFVVNQDTACAMSSYFAGAYDAEHNDPRFIPVRVQLAYSKSASNEDVEDAASEVELDVDWGEDSHAYVVATEKKLREYLQSKGFDAYADYSFFENIEPMQIVVFAKHQVTVL